MVVYEKFCVYCEDKRYTYPAYIFSTLVAAIGFIVLIWLLWLSFRKFVNDGATLTSEGQSNQIESVASSFNRISKTAALL